VTTVSLKSYSEEGEGSLEAGLKKKEGGYDVRESRPSPASRKRRRGGHNGRNLREARLRIMRTFFSASPGGNTPEKGAGRKILELPELSAIKFAKEAEHSWGRTVKSSADYPRRDPARVRIPYRFAKEGEEGRDVTEGSRNNQRSDKSPLLRF